MSGIFRTVWQPYAMPTRDKNSENFPPLLARMKSLSSEAENGKSRFAIKK